jgi:hypothetical protein
MNILSYGLYYLINQHIEPIQNWILTIFSILILKYEFWGLTLLPLLSLPNLHLPLCFETYEIESWGKWQVIPIDCECLRCLILICDDNIGGSLIWVLLV